MTSVLCTLTLYFYISDHLSVSDPALIFPGTSLQMPFCVCSQGVDFQNTGESSSTNFGFPK